jgi:hypothetical protein
VDEAFSACAFFLLEGTFVKAHFGVIHEFAAFDAQLFTLCVMVTVAIDVNHCVDGFLFSSYSGVLGQRVPLLRALILVSGKISIA